jgi:hypothetical protein
MRLRTLSLVTVCLAATVAAAESPMREGKWEVTTQMEMPGAPVALPAMKQTRCITTEQLEDPNASLPGSPDPGNDCKVSDYQVAGQTVTWKLACTKPNKVTGDGELTVDGDAYTGTMKLAMDEGAMNMRYTAKRLGDCTE